MSDNEDDVEALVPTPVFPQVHPEVWQDIEDLLFRGFLTVSGEINGVPWVLKSLNARELDLVRLYSGGDTDKGLLYAAMFGTFLFAGQNVICDRQSWITEFASVWPTLASEVRSDVIRLLSVVNLKAQQATKLTEAFFCDPSSRFRWQQYRGLLLNDPAVTGIPGTREIGQNYAQLVWCALNRLEDDRERIEANWDNAKFIGSCIAGKAVQKIYRQDQARRRKIIEDRIAQRDILLRKVLLLESDDTMTIDGVRRVVARTSADLLAQYERERRGERDWHDEVIAREEEKIRANLLARQALQTHPAPQDSQALRTLSPEETLKLKNAGLNTPKHFDEGQAAFLERYLSVESPPAKYPSRL